MQVIPVIDLMNGLVVHAMKGERRHYRPIRDSRLAPDPAPEAVIDALLAFYPFRQIYLADLDALTGGPAQTKLILHLVRRYKEIEWWLDDGGIGMKLTGGQVRQVIGTESMGAETAHAVSWRQNDVLSIDYRCGELLGCLPSGWQERMAQPDTVIHMNLDYVGSTEGPDWCGIQQLVTERPDCRVVASGGVRGRADLKRLDAMGVWGVMLATALHNGSLSAEELRSMSPVLCRNPVTA